MAGAELAGAAEVAAGVAVPEAPLRGGLDPSGEGLLGALLRPGNEKPPEAGAGAGALAAGCEDVAGAEDPKLNGELAGAGAAGEAAGAEVLWAPPSAPPPKRDGAAGAEVAGVEDDEVAAG